MIIIEDARKMVPDMFPHKFGAMILDVPWPYDNNMGGEPRNGAYTYDSMTMEEICNMPVYDLGENNCAYYVWGTWPKVPQIVHAFEAWGLEHVTGFPWVKITRDWERPLYRTGHWVAGCSEYVLIGRKGKVSPPSPPRFLGLLGPGLEHSRKPESLHELIEGNSEIGCNGLDGPYGELFARRDREGWTTFGNEIKDKKGVIHRLDLRTGIRTKIVPEQTRLI